VYTCVAAVSTCKHYYRYSNQHSYVVLLQQTTVNTAQRFVNNAHNKVLLLAPSFMIQLYCMNVRDTTVVFVLLYYLFIVKECTDLELQ
jgi:hypothetical protein